MPKIKNPILPGFNPDPSICRVGADYYIATSTFEWYPGVQIHHSKDLANWALITRPLTRAAQLDMRGNPDSCGIWAPCLTHADNQFWLIYTDVKRKDGSFKDAHNYLVTAPSIRGPWSDRIYLNSSGFDPSLFHDDNGKKWLVNMLWDHRIRPRLFAGIALQEYSIAERRLVGPIRNIFQGIDLLFTEGPHLYKRKGRDGKSWYYLLTAEGGTGYDHAVCFARSRKLEGPYEIHPQTHILTARHNPEHPLQRAGHADICDTPDGKTYLVHLTGRPLPETRTGPLGRETSLQEAEWGDDDWLWVKGGPLPALEVDVPGAFDEKKFWAEKHYHFNAPELPIDFQWLRSPEPGRLFSMTADHNHLRLYGRESIGSWFEQSLVARRLAHFAAECSTTIDFSPRDERQMAGLIAYYNRYQFHYLAVTAHSEGQRELLIVSCPGDYPEGRLTFPADPVKIPNTGRIDLSMRITRGKLQFFYALQEEGAPRPENAVRPIGPVIDASILGDEAGQGPHGNFTGAFVGVTAHDLNGSALHADFSHFSYHPLRAEAERVPV
ncbi:MAG: glycoside hydrolase family 43 protein [Cucumibacter sp.]